MGRMRLLLKCLQQTCAWHFSSNLNQEHGLWQGVTQLGLVFVQTECS